MKRILVTVFVVAASIVVGGQTLAPSGGGGVNAGVTRTIGCTANQILWSNGSVINCGSAVTFSDGGIANDGNLHDISAGFAAGTNGFDVFNNATKLLTMDISGVTLISTSPVRFWNGTDLGSGAADTSVSRSVAGVVAFGTGAAGNAAGGYITATATLTALTTGTNADFLCLAANGTILLQNSSCTISSLRFKPDWKPYTDDALTKVSGLDVGTFHLQTGPNADPNAQSMQAGLSAESIAAIAPECAVYENDMKTPKSYRQECVLALLVKAIQELKNDRHHQ